MTIRSWWGGIATAVALAAGAVLPAQQAPPAGWTLNAGFWESAVTGDHVELAAHGGVQLTAGDLALYAERALVVLDRDRSREVLTSDDGEGPPRRDAVPPDPRRVLTEAVLRARLQSFVRAARGDVPPASPSAASIPLGVLQAMYLEGDVVVLQGGREVARAGRLHFATADDRLVLHDALLRVWSPRQSLEVVVLRGAELVRQGSRTVGRDVSVTTCNAGEPHVEVLAGEVQLIERGDTFEVRTRDGRLAVLGNGIVPLPDLAFYTDQRPWLPIQGVSGGYSDREGARAGIDLGGAWNDVGGALHRWLTGRAAAEFRGGWHLGLGFVEERGFPTDASLTYRAEGLYHGYLEGFWLDDNGEDLREIQNRLDGQPIVEDERRLLHTENRILLGERTSLDLSTFLASDAAVWPEFEPNDYREDELPETSAHLRHADENVLLTATARVNPNSFAYRSDRGLDGSFLEEVPRATFDVFSEPVLELPGETPLLLTSASDVGWLRLDRDPTVPLVEPEVLRADQEFELATPFLLGPVGVRPFLSARATLYDETAVEDEVDVRGAFSAGVRLATWLSRAWHGVDGNGRARALRHVMSPAVVLVDRFEVTDDPAELLQLDELDALDERSEIRLELLNRLQSRIEDGEIEELLWLDLAQTVFRDADRDNDGDHLGLFEYELIVRPAQRWLPVPNLLLLVEGEHDWDEGEERTLNAGVRFGPVLGLNWGAEFRDDRVTEGTLGYELSTRLFTRWTVAGRGQYDLDREETINYSIALVRQDHDWRLTAGVAFDTISEETRFFVDFEPTLSGLIARRPGRYLGGTGFEGMGY